MYLVCALQAIRRGSLGDTQYRNIVRTIGKLLVLTATSSNCKVKITRFYEFVFTLGQR